MFDTNVTHMKTVETALAANGTEKVYLKKLTDQLMDIFSPVAAHHNSQLVNQIPENLCTTVDERLLVKIIYGMLHAVLNNARDTTVRLSGKLSYGNMIEIFIKDNNSYHTYAIACGLQDVVPIAGRMGGDINIISQHQNLTTVSFTFPSGF
jgi:hypothetical protein